MCSSDLIAHMQISYSEISNYDKNGIFTSYYQYPKCNCFTKKDSLAFAKKIANISHSGNQTTVSEYFSDNEISNQKTYENGNLIKELSVFEYIQGTNDSLSKKIREKKIYKYEYNKKGKLIETFINDRLVIAYDYSHKDKEYYSFYDRYSYNDTIRSQHNMNQITRDKNGNITESLYYVKGYKDMMISYKFIYDFQNKLSSIIKIRGGNNYSEIESIMNYSNYYEKDILSEVIENVENPELTTTYKFYPNGLIKSTTKFGVTEEYEYSFYEN